MSKPNFTIRPIELSDCDQVRDIWLSAGFLIFKYMNEVMIKFDPEGILVAQDQDSGKLLGVCSGVNLSADLAFIGQYAVLPECRGLGIGLELWRNAMQHIGTDRNIALSGVLNMADKYRKSGFVVDNGKNVLFYEGKARLDELCDRNDAISIDSINDTNIEKVVEYDRHVCRVDRRLFIEQKSKCENTFTSVALNARQEVVGYAMIGLSILGTAMIEPLYADDRPTAELLVSTLCKTMPTVAEVDLVYTVWDTNKESIDLATKLGLELKATERLMSTKSVVPALDSKIFCVSSTTFYPF